MSNTRVRGPRNIGLSFLAIALLVIAVANLPAEYSLPALMYNNAADAAHNTNDDKVSLSSESFKSGWRYTKNGWQNLSDWKIPVAVGRPALHPAVVGSLQLLVCMAVLVAFSARK